MANSIHPSAVILPSTELGEGTRVGAFSVIGKPYRLVGGEPYGSAQPTRVERGCEIGTHVVVGQGTSLSDNCIIEDGCILEVDVRIEARTRMIYRAYVCNEASIGADCVIGGFICERAVIGSRCRIFGDLVHSQLDPTAPWDDTEEDSPLIEEGSFIGFGARVIGPTRIGRSAYVCAGAIVTRDVPARHIAFGVNRNCHFSDWTGPLSKSSMFQG